jgi:predicted nucleic acid-binding protein
MARRSVGPSWPSLVLDSEGLWAVANNHDGAKAATELASEMGSLVFVPSVVLAETLRGDAGDAPANRVLNKLQTVNIDVSLARRAAQLKRAADMVGVAATVDALVVAVSERLGGGVVLTSDPRDINALSDHAGVRVRAIPV